MKFRKKPVEVDAIQWNNNGDHPKVRKISPADVLGYFKYACPMCGASNTLHGWLETLEGGQLVCPGDWIIRGIHREFYPCKPDIFEQTYEKI